MAEVISSLTANAIISKEKWRDEFDRTTGNNIPFLSTDWGPDWTVTYVTTGGATWIDGSCARLSANKGMDAAPSSDKRVSYGFVQFDFWVPANISDTRPYWFASQGSEYPVGVEAYQSSGSTWQVGTYYYYSSVDAYYSFVPTPSTWYRVKGVFNGARGGLLAVKVWKRDDPEPGSFNAVGEIGSDADPILDPNDWFEIAVGITAPTAEEGALDNLIYGDYGAPFSTTVWGSLTAGAILRKTMPTQYRVADAIIAPRRFTAGAWIIGGRAGHSRLLDHYGTQPDTYVVLDGAIGQYQSGTTVHYVLSDLVARVTALEAGNHVVLTFTAGAFIQPWLRASAVLFKTVTSDPTWGTLDFDAEAVIVAGKTDQPITADALIVGLPRSFGVDAYLIDLVC